MSRPTWVVTLLKKTFPGRLLAARATRLPVVGRALERWLFEGDDLLYLPTDRVIQIHQPVVEIDHVALPSHIVEHFIETAQVHWIMHSCICRSAEQCKDYPIDLGCLFLGKAAQGINPALGRRVTKEEALEHARRCRDAGLVHLIGRNKLDTVWLGVGPGEKLLTICNCCPCCCLWRILPHVAPRIGDKVQRLPGVRVQVSAQCVGCGTCTEGVCFADAIRLTDGRAFITTACRGCGRCVSACPHGAIDISIDDEAFVAEAVARIESAVDVS